MKKITRTLAFLFTVLAIPLSAQIAQPSTFEDLTLSPNSYNDGASGSGDFSSGSATFNNVYNTSFGYWESGFAYSNIGDTAVTPADFMTQLYATTAGSGDLHSANFGIGTLNAHITLDSPAVYVDGLWVTNTTYAYNSMAFGDSFGKKFGDTTNSPHSAPGVNEGYPDWFKLSITGYHRGSMVGTIDFYLADFRFADNSQDYIVKDWQHIDLSTIPTSDSLEFVLSSSDNGAFGMNTPAYFCIDNFISHEVVTSVPSLSKAATMNVYPNPFADQFVIDMRTAAERSIRVYNAFGQLVLDEQSSDAKVNINLDSNDAGIYFVHVLENGRSSVQRIIKK